MLTPYFQLSADTPGALAHALQAKVSRAPFLAEHPRIDTDPIVPHSDAKVPFGIPDLDFDSTRPRVVEGVTQGLSRDSVDLIPQYRIQV